MFVSPRTNREQMPESYRAGRPPLASRRWLVNDFVLLVALVAMLWVVAASPRLIRRACGEPEGDERLINAICGGDVRAAREALDDGASPNANLNGASALMLTRDARLARL